MAVPTNTANPGTISATAEDNGVLVSVNKTIPDAVMTVRLSGTYTTGVVVVRARLAGLYDSSDGSAGVYGAISGVDAQTTLPVGTAGSITLANSTTYTLNFPVGPYDYVEIYASSLASGAIVVGTAQAPPSQVSPPVVNATVTGASAATGTFSTSLSLPDNATLLFGTGDDISVTWNASALAVTQAAADSDVLWGVSGAGINHTFYGDTAGRNLQWDQTNDQLLFLDSAKLALGTGSDIVFAWDGTDLDVTQAAANSSIKWGVDGAGIDQVWYGDTASTSMTWDQSADSLILAGAAPLVFSGTTGQPEIQLTDNLADALSIEIAGSTDLLTFTTTNNAESVSPIGLRTRSSTAVAITGATTLTLADSGGIFTVGQGSAYDIDLPSPTTGPGCRYFFSLTAPAANAVTITVAGSAATFVGSIVSEGQIVVATGSTLTFASGAALLGDSIEIQSIATNLYHVRAIASALNGITVA